MMPLFPTALHAQVQALNADDLTNFAFARYLGSGFYTTGDSRIFVLQLPLTSQLKPLTRDEYGLVLQYPFTLGFTDVSFEGIADGNIPDINDVATLSFVPGLEFQYQVLDNWMLAPFADLGFAHDLGSGDYVRILGFGVKSLATFKHGENSITFGNRLLYADESKLDIEGNSNFSVIETGLDYRIPTDIDINGGRLDFSLYYINYYYRKDLVILKILDNPIKLVNINEFGFTFSLPKHDWLPEKPRLGFGIQFAGEITVYRIVFGMPFF